MTAHLSPEKQPRRILVWFGIGIVLVVVAGGAWFFLLPPAPGNAPLSQNGPLPEPEDPPFKASGPAWFREMTAGSGLDFTYRNGEKAQQFTILESLGGGVALFDYDGDGLLDIFVVGGGYFAGPDKKELKGYPCKLYKNLGNWKFRDVTKEVGLDGVSWWYTHGVAVADYDRDGWPDLLVTGYGRLALFRNVDDGKGGRRFVDVTKDVGLKDDSWSTSAGWADLDGDGFPDLYVCHYADWSWANHPLCRGPQPGNGRDVCAPLRFKPLVHSVFRNEGGKHFSDETVQQGFKPAGRGLGVVLVDVNDDGKPDIYVGNDASNNFLFVNRSKERLLLEEKGLAAGVATDETGRYDNSMGVDAGDYEGNGLPALWATNFQGDIHALYANRGKERFQHRSRVSGISTIGQQWVGFGTAFLDVDNDGWEDLVIINGHVMHYPILGSDYKQRPILLRNTENMGRRFFQDIGVQGGEFFATPQLGRGLAIGDLDNDGWTDMVVTFQNHPVALLRNEAGSAIKPAPRWLGIGLKGKENRDIVGSTVIVELASGRKLTRFAKSGGSYLSASDPRLLFGLGATEEVKRVTVKWSWGQSQHWAGDALQLGLYWELHEGQPVPLRQRKNSIQNTAPPG